MRNKTAVVSMLVFLAVSACGGSSDAPKTTPTTTASASASASSPTTSSAGELTGTWAGTYASKKFPETKGGFTVVFAQTGSKLSGAITLEGACITDGTLEGTLTGATIDFGAVKGEGRAVSFTGSFAGDQMQGTYSSDPSCGDDKGTWTASRS